MYTDVVMCSGYNIVITFYFTSNFKSLNINIKNNLNKNVIKVFQNLMKHNMSMCH